LILYKFKVGNIRDEVKSIVASLMLLSEEQSLIYTAGASCCWNNKNRICIGLPIKIGIDSFFSLIYSRAVTET
jgi:hypothetical protein